MLRIQHLYKSYGNFTALNSLSLHVEKGELYGFVGANGAGKTTTMKIAAGLLLADHGEVYVGGIDVRKEPKKLKEKIGYMPDFFGVYDNLKAIEYMEFYASIYNINGKEARKLCLELMDLVNLQDKADRYVDSLSRGMKQRLCLARCLVNNPELLILDEPASGLDPNARFDMKEILKNLCEMGKTIIISSHILSELAEMCTSIGIIKNGEMVLSDSVEGIFSAITMANPVVIQVTEGMDQAANLIKEHPLTGQITIKEPTIKFEFRGEAQDEADLLKMLILQGVSVNGFKREEGNLESLFIELTRKGEKI